MFQLIEDEGALLLAAAGPWRLTSICLKLRTKNIPRIHATFRRFRKEGVMWLRQLRAPNQPVKLLPLPPGDRAVLAKLLGDPNTPPRIARRARAVLAAESGATVAVISSILGVKNSFAREWIRRYQKGGLTRLLLLRSDQRQGQFSSLAIHLTASEKLLLKKFASRTRGRPAQRARAILAASESPYGIKPVLQASGLGYTSVIRALQAYQAGGVVGLKKLGDG